ncbi:hypothetical protein KJ564_12360 [bacterium]|nr:hypothetical protein [bacterium]
MKFFEWTALLGALAWTPHLIKIIKDKLTRPVVRIITQRSVEIGFTPLGPIFNLRIAFAVKYRDIVISSIRVKLRHESGEVKTLSWQGITQRLGQFSPPEAVPIPWEKEISVLAIKLTEKEVEERHIRFNEDEFYTNKEKYESKVTKKLTYLKNKGEYNVQDFLKSEEITDLISFLRQWFNWKQGDYTVTFEVDSPEKFILMDNKYSFSINPIQIDLLQGNLEPLLKQFEDELNLGIEGYTPHKVHYNWVYPILKKS